MRLVQLSKWLHRWVKCPYNKKIVAFSKSRFLFIIIAYFSGKGMCPPDVEPTLI